MNIKKKTYGSCNLLTRGRKTYALQFVCVRYALFYASSVFYATFIIAHFGFTGGGQFTVCLTDLRHVRNLPPDIFFINDLTLMTRVTKCLLFT